MKIDIHTHSSYSDGANTPGEMVRYAKKIGLDGIAITDHNVIDGAIKALRYNSENFTVIPGIEVSSKEGHILGLGITELIERAIPAEEVVERIHELGGIAIAAHPYDRFRSGVGDLLYKIDFDAVEVINGRTLLTTRDMTKIAKNIKLPKVGGSDAHSLDELGSVSIVVDNDPIESILKGNVEIVADVKKLRVLAGFLKRRIRGFL
ncbi:MAG: metal-dependent phosphoesterase [Candidatus Altiarchaeales archaeon]|nr:MAG: metal-dependent phosphoesterase [Candidatus Altiarchaeales archaeon]